MNAHWTRLEESTHCSRAVLVIITAGSEARVADTDDRTVQVFEAEQDRRCRHTHAIAFVASSEIARLRPSALPVITSGLIGS